jgi:hypothetical protein
MTMRPMLLRVWSASTTRTTRNGRRIWLGRVVRKRTAEGLEARSSGKMATGADLWAKPLTFAGRSPMGLNQSASRYKVAETAWDESIGGMVVGLWYLHDHGVSDQADR